jgi:hypothetical protein
MQQAFANRIGRVHAIVGRPDGLEWKGASFFGQPSRGSDGAIAFRDTGGPITSG